MARRLVLLALLTAAIVVASASARSHSRHGVLALGAYTNPFTNPAWQPGRTDMGVDWHPRRRLPVRAIGDAVILGSESHNYGWPGARIIWYQLLDGSHAGDIIYVAEHLRNIIPAGRLVKAGQMIATAIPGYPWTEWGWADYQGTPRAHPCYHEGEQTNSGKEMARFMRSLGARLYKSPGLGPDRPTGRLC